VRAVDSPSRTRGDADDYNSSCLFWDDAGVDAKRSFARVSALARGNWPNPHLEFDDQPPYPNAQQPDPTARRNDGGGKKGRPKH
jgi:hypothetical protein